MKKFLQENAIALASLVVAASSLGLAYWIQERDFQYKELSIKPEITVSYDSDQYSFKLKNAGLGPAVINKIVFRLGGRCIDAFSLNTQDHFSLLLLLIDHLYVGPIRTIGLPIVVPIPQESGVHANILAFRKGFALPQGADLPIFSLSKEQASLLSTKLAEYSVEERNRLMQTFFNAAVNVPMGSVYCSISGRYCRTVPLKGCLE